MTNDMRQPAAPAAGSAQAQKPSQSRAALLARRWPTKRKINRAAEARYTRIVNALKITLPALALIIVAMVLVYSSFNPNPSSLILHPEELEIHGDDLRMINPRLRGVDGAQRPYTVAAEYAQQQKGRPDLILLVNIEADVTLEKDQWLSLTAAQGHLNGEAQTLTLDGGISVFSDSGYELHTEQAIVDFNKGEIKGPSAVQAQGPLGIIKANGFEVFRDLQQVHFLNGVETVYTPPPQAPGASDGFEPIPEEEQ